jgi:nucleoside-diphosphate-sugar epimerase
MKVLVCGARGFIGRRIGTALQARGHRVVEGVSVASGDAVAVDFVRDVDPRTWAPRLRGIDAVVNAVGVLRDTRQRPIEDVHDQVPRALFAACAELGVRRVVQLSALGITGSATPYALTKLAAEATLEAHTQEGELDGFIVRPSIVFGRGGDSSELFLALARLPLALLPGPVRRARIQPVAVGELAEVIVTLLEAAPSAATTIAAVGPVPVALGEFIASLRAQAGRAPAHVGTLPDFVTRLSARAGDLVPVSPWCSDALALLGADNVADPAPFERLLGRPATRYDALLAGAAA